MANELKLPLGIQTFEKLRERNCVYVGKTRYSIDLIKNVDICFLARPRRFGKSLTVSTFDALFSGKKEFLNYWIHSGRSSNYMKDENLTVDQFRNFPNEGECPAKKAEEALQQIIDKNYAN